MLRYFIKRVLWMIPICLGVSLIVFVMVNSIPGDPGTIILGSSATEEEIRAINEQLGYYDPLWVRYFDFLKGAVQLDFGQSYITRHDVFDDICEKFTVSIKIASAATLCTIAIGIPVGVLSAVKQYSIVDHVSRTIAMFLATAPSFWVGLILILLFSMKLDWLPSFGMDEPGWLIMPMLTCAALHGATTMRYTRSSMLDTIRQDYIRTIRAKGATETRVIWAHAIKNALIPVVTTVGSTFATLLGGAIVTESLFSLPGLGSYIVNGVKQRDVPAVMGGVLTISVLHALIILAVDMISAMIDPRIKAKFTKKR